MKRIIALVLLSISPLVATASVSVGGVAIRVPTPAGFTEITSDMQPIYGVNKQVAAGPNQELAFFLPTDVVSAALFGGKVPDRPRRLSVKVSTTMLDLTASPSDFRELARRLRDQTAEVAKKSETELAEASARFKGNAQGDVGFTVSKIEPMAPHEETDRSFAYSSWVHGSLRDETGMPVPEMGAVTTTAVHVNGKILFLFAFGRQSDLEWTRTASKAWADTVLAANPAELPEDSPAAPPFGVVALAMIVALGAVYRWSRK